MDESSKLRPLKPLLPLHLGLIVAQAIYVWLFWQELYCLVMAAFGHIPSLEHILDAVTMATSPSGSRT